MIEPFDQIFPVVAEEVKSTLFPSQKVVIPLAEIVGVVGVAFTITEVISDCNEEHPFASV